ncbi:PIG-L family deacetylase [Paeniglutamicibacter sp. ORCA_105]|uniref:PIG-L family deacetylase n=1 Tax=Paeniglutamicibacter sp. ORCA_105 TaxID=3377336 RepID=UPI0038955111
MVSFTHLEPGTEETLWLAAGVTKLPALPMDCFAGAAHSLVVLSAHPDDETLGAAGLIHQALRAGTAVHVIVATAGEASHPDSPTHSPERLAGIRVAELAQALGELTPDSPGAGTLTFETLGLPDGSLASHSRQIQSAIRKATAKGRTTLVAPYRRDGHTDHDALGALAASLADELGHGLLEYPIWYWHWATPERDTEWEHWGSLAMDADTTRAKTRATESHRSQVAPLSDAPQDAPLLQDSFLQHFRRTIETFRFTPPGYRDSATASATFDGLYERRPDPWDYLGSAYERRKRAITLASLPRSRYGAVIELGCSIGVLSRDLAQRADTLLAVDASRVALESAAPRLAGFNHVVLSQAVLPHEWPDVMPGSQDLVVVSEIGYFLAADELDLLYARCLEALSAGGHLLLCHWLHPVSGWPMDGAQVHAAAQGLGLATKVLHRETDFVLEVLEKAGGNDG